MLLGRDVRGRVSWGVCQAFVDWCGDLPRCRAAVRGRREWAQNSSEPEPPAARPGCGGVSGGSLDAFEMTAQPNARMPVPHYHESWDELVHGLAGTFVWRVDGQDITRTPTADLARRLAILGQNTGIASRLRVRELVSFGRWPHCHGPSMAHFSAAASASALRTAIRRASFSFRNTWCCSTDW